MTGLSSLMGIDTAASAAVSLRAVEQAQKIRSQSPGYSDKLRAAWDAEVDISRGVLAMYEDREALGDLDKESLVAFVVATLKATEGRSSAFQLGLALAAENILKNEVGDDHGA